jgi:hypothetical protein
MIPRTPWEDLPDEVRDAIIERTGPVLAAESVSAGQNAAVALRLRTSTGAVFVKGLRKDHPGAVTQEREAAVNPYIRSVGPTLLWHTEVDAWNLLGFAHLPGRHADYRPGSADIAKIVETMNNLASLPCPDLPQVKRAELRWAEHVENPADAAPLAGRTLLHTDYNPDNVIINGRHARLIDWAWPTRGAAFIDPACFVVRLIAAGNTPSDAEDVAQSLPAWRNDPNQSIDVFAIALTRMWTQIASADPSPWKLVTAEAAQQWAHHRHAR